MLFSNISIEIVFFIPVNKLISPFSIVAHSVTQYVCTISIVIAVSALKVLIWFLVFDLLHKLELKSPFTMKVTEKLERIAYLLLAIWALMSIIGKTYAHYLMESTGIQLTVYDAGDEYFFMAGIIYIISQIFKRGIEMQEENALTV